MVNSAQQWLADYDATLARAAADAQAASASLKQVNGTATSPRGEISVQVGPSGALVDIRLTPAARALEAEKLAQLILTTTQQAQRMVGTHVMEIMTDYLGEGPALEFVRENMPVDTDEPPQDDDDFFANPRVIV
ncbi:YbaB/EbfC family nucleoid-associated protein [Saccharopolyspora sp. TS4A08]|uniref:YbaB/EbfC family nucleoid-associated protein n=1 Tax=Saccharopolyspora ipomoeae TaxID=3042027 RepID=A0ABT6PSP7_9PSEU|nr:YbaB/EbfC family nucleoid-associated protein [Saccharopolyspora sp. TS4A08]MDI2031039.1 YbaB/EbfC family nucleoid-associated protein [Saccharopolyspora sp. TS4A08]